MGFLSLAQKSYLINVIQKALRYNSAMALIQQDQVECYYKY